MADEQNRQQAERDRLVAALCCLQTPQEVEALLSDLLTSREIDDLSQRLEVATMLSKGRSYLDVSRSTGVSSTTVSRVSKCLNGPAGGYRLVLSRIGDGGETYGEKTAGEASRAAD